MRRGRAAAFLALGAALGTSLPGSACSARHRRAVGGPAGAPPVESTVAYETLPDPRAVLPALTRHQVFMAPVPVDAPLPEYPKEALAANAPPVTATVRVVVSEEGRVRDVLDSPMATAAEKGNRPEFRRAVEAAVRTWRYKAATIRTEKEGEEIPREGEDTVTNETAVPTYLDLRFTFEVIGGAGRVRVAPGA